MPPPHHRSRPILQFDLSIACIIIMLLAETADELLDVWNMASTFEPRMTDYEVAVTAQYLLYPLTLIFFLWVLLPSTFTIIPDQAHNTQDWERGPGGRFSHSSYPLKNSSLSRHIRLPIARTPE